MSRNAPAAAALCALVALGGCQSGSDAPATRAGAETADTSDSRPLGPADGLDLPGVDLDRIQVGDPAPDFTLASYQGPPVTLSDFRGEKDVILVFYRGHW